MTAAPDSQPDPKTDPAPGPDDVLATYDRIGPDWAETRDRTLFERRWLDRFLAHVPRRPGGPEILDLGCGAGRPIAEYLADRGARLTGVDGSAAMADLFARIVPGAAAHHADMRGLALGQRFDGILAWNSFFHLSAPDQEAMFPVFAAHAAPDAALMLTTGHRAGTATGHVAGQPVFHASLDPGVYRTLLARADFEVLDYRPEDPECRGHTIWLARHRGVTGG